MMPRRTRELPRPTPSEALNAWSRTGRRLYPQHTRTAPNGGYPCGYCWRARRVLWSADGFGRGPAGGPGGGIPVSAHLAPACLWQIWITGRPSLLRRIAGGVHRSRSWRDCRFRRSPRYVRGRELMPPAAGLGIGACVRRALTAVAEFRQLTDVLQ